MAKGRQKRLNFFLAALVAISAISGCDSQASRTGDNTPDSPSKETSKVGQQAAPKGGKAPAPALAETETIEVVLYFSDAQAEKLVKEVRRVPKAEAVAQAAVEELIKGPAQGEGATVPKETRLLGIDIKNGVAEVNMSKEFVDNHPGGSAGERLTVYSIVNTLTELSAIEEVRFLVEGDPVDTIAGHMDISQPVKREESLL